MADYLGTNHIVGWKFWKTSLWLSWLETHSQWASIDSYGETMANDTAHVQHGRLRVVRLKSSAYQDISQSSCVLCPSKQHLTSARKERPSTNNQLYFSSWKTNLSGSCLTFKFKILVLRIPCSLWMIIVATSKRHWKKFPPIDNGNCSSFFQNTNQLYQKK